MSNINITTLFTNQTVTLVKKDNSSVESIRIVSAVDMFGISFYDSMEQPKFLSYEELKEYNIIRNMSNDDFLKMANAIKELNIIGERLEEDELRYDHLDSYIERLVKRDFAPFNINMINDRRNIVTISSKSSIEEMDKELRACGKPYNISQNHPVLILDTTQNLAKVGTFVCGEWFEFSTLVNQKSLIPFTVTPDTMFFNTGHGIRTVISITSIDSTIEAFKKFDPETGRLV